MQWILAGIRRAAFVSHGGKRLLAVEPGDGFDKAIQQALRTDLTWAALDEIRPLEHLPVDKSHNAKIDYPALRRLLHS